MWPISGGDDDDKSLLKNVLLQFCKSVRICNKSAERCHEQQAWPACR